MLSKFSDKKIEKSKYCDTIECNSLILALKFIFLPRESIIYKVFGKQPTLF